MGEKINRVGTVFQGGNILILLALVLLLLILLFTLALALYSCS